MDTKEVHQEQPTDVQDNTNKEYGISDFNVSTKETEVSGKKQNKRQCMGRVDLRKIEMSRGVLHVDKVITKDINYVDDSDEELLEKEKLIEEFLLDARQE